MEELYSLDDESLGRLHPIYGLVFLFKWQKPPADAPVAVKTEDPTIFFANQVSRAAAPPAPSAGTSCFTQLTRRGRRRSVRWSTTPVQRRR